MDLINVITDGSMRVLALHAKDKHIDAVPCLPALRQIIKDEYKELLDTLKDATDAHMGDAMYRSIINTYCNSWAVKALKGVVPCQSK